MQAISSVVILGGGSAGWLTAAILASKHPFSVKDNTGLLVKVIEAPDIPTVGVGEGTWPSMKATLQSVGIDEFEFIRACSVSLKQGSKFIGWKDGSSQDEYYHPFDLPEGFYEGNFAQAWINANAKEDFAYWASMQAHLCEKALAPKLPTSARYGGFANYGYHLDAGKFAEFLKRHCIQKLGVQFVPDKVVEVVSAENGDIAGLKTLKSGFHGADLFVDCTGFSAVLLGKHYAIETIDKSDTLPINNAVATHVPYLPQEPIASTTHSTAQDAGWIWDIGLSSRRGVGHVFCDAYVSRDAAIEQLRSYLGVSEQKLSEFGIKEIFIKPGYRQKFWHKNCVAIGLSAGFLEPLEASAMMLIEVSANMLAEQFPVNREAMEIIAARYNRRSHFRWQRIIDFLKLHYLLTKREQPFWRAVSSEATVSGRLKEELALWKHQPPWKTDFESLDEAFPSASYQYVLYGMGYQTAQNDKMMHAAQHAFVHCAAGELARKVDGVVPRALSNREFLEIINNQTY